ARRTPGWHRRRRTNRGTSARRSEGPGPPASARLRRGRARKPRPPGSCQRGRLTGCRARMSYRVRMSYGMDDASTRPGRGQRIVTPNPRPRQPVPRHEDAYAGLRSTVRPMRSSITGVSFVLAVLVSSAPVAQEQERMDTDTYWKIRREAMEHSQILKTLHVLTDVHGPRLTGSPNLKRASDWVVTQATEWGLTNAHLEPWEFGHPGWLNERLSVHEVSPVKDALVVEALAWTPGPKGAVTAEPVAV